MAVIGLLFYAWGVSSAWRNPSLVQAEQELTAAAKAEAEAAGEPDDDRREKAAAGV